MAAQTGQRSERLAARVAPEVMAIVRRAAEIEGRSVSAFVIDAARQAALKTIDDTHVIRLAAEDQLRFVQLLLDSPPLTPAMERARAAHDRLTQD